MNDFVSSYETPKNYLRERNGNPFEIFSLYDEDSKDENTYVFSIRPMLNSVLLDPDQELGEFTRKYFPTRSKKIKNKVFVWYDEEVPLTKDIIYVLNEHQMLDSMEVKRKLGLIPRDSLDTGVYILDDSLKGWHYYVCKNRIDKFRLKVSSTAFGYYDAPDIQCEITER